MNIHSLLLFLLLLVARSIFSQSVNPYSPDSNPPPTIPGMTLAWSDEFNTDGKPNVLNWNYESGFVRNQELQWYQPENAYCFKGALVIEARKENLQNPHYKPSDINWNVNRKNADYTSASLKTQGLQQFKFGRLEIRARIDTSAGSWPAIWTLGIQGDWPLNGEVDIMEFYRIKTIPMILGNLAWGKSEKGGPIWNTKTVPMSWFVSKDPEWTKKFHIWRMDWNEDSINIYLDDVLLNTAENTQKENDSKISFYFLHG